MNGRDLALGAAGLLAIGGAVRARVGSRATSNDLVLSAIPGDSLQTFDHPDAYGVADVDADAGVLAIYEFTSKHPGGGRAFLQAMRPRFAHVAAFSIGEAADVRRARRTGERCAASFWLQVAREGLVDKLTDDEGNRVPVSRAVASLAGIAAFPRKAGSRSRVSLADRLALHSAEILTEAAMDDVASAIDEGRLCSGEGVALYDAMAQEPRGYVGASTPDSARRPLAARMREPVETVLHPGVYKDDENLALPEHNVGVGIRRGSPIHRWIVADTARFMLRADGRDLGSPLHPRSASMWMDPTILHRALRSVSEWVADPTPENRQQCEHVNAIYNRDQPPQHGWAPITLLLRCAWMGPGWAENTVEETVHRAHLNPEFDSLSKRTRAERMARRRRQLIMALQFSLPGRPTIFSWPETR